MKIIITSFALALLCGIWQLAGSLSKIQMSKLESEGVITYGPLPEISSESYVFNSFSTDLMLQYPVQRISDLSKSKFESIILSGLEDKDQKNLRKYLTNILTVSEEYQLDPFWVLSIVMVESRFNPGVTSHKNAQGLMQIRPSTAVHLYQIMGKEISHNDLDLYHVDENLELGTFYLKKLLQNFKMNFKNATIAYNMGPGRLKNLLQNDELVYEENEYYTSVLKNHQRFRKAYLKEIALIPEISKKKSIVKN
jgi:soluble lytic murein transglycosylase